MTQIDHVKGLRRARRRPRPPVSFPLLSRYSLNMLNNNGNTERPKPTTLHRPAVFEGSSPKMRAVCLIPSNAQLALIDAEETVIGDVSTDFVAELNYGQRHRRRGEREGQKILILAEGLVR